MSDLVSGLPKLPPRVEVGDTASRITTAFCPRGIGLALSIPPSMGEGLAIRRDESLEGRLNGEAPRATAPDGVDKFWRVDVAFVGLLLCWELLSLEEVNEDIRVARSPAPAALLFERVGEELCAKPWAIGAAPFVAEKLPPPGLSDSARFRTASFRVVSI